MPEKPERPATRFLASLYAPPAQRPLLDALFDIEREIAASVRPGLDHRVAHTRLQWWREECERVAQGKPLHPLTRDLVAAYHRGQVSAHADPNPAHVALGANRQGDPGHTDTKPAGPSNSPTGSDERAARALAGLSGLVDTAVWDLAAATFETRREVTAYCERWSGAMIEPAMTALSPNGGWRVWGTTLRELELLTQLAQDAHVGRLRLPLAELERAGLDPAVVAQAPWPSALAALVSERHEALRAALSVSVSELSPAEQPEARGLLVWTALVWRRSLRAQRSLPNSPTETRLDAVTEAWYAWRAARRAMMGAFRLGAG